MPTQIAHKNLMDEIERIPTQPKHQFLLSLVHKKEYSLALLKGCMFCDAADSIQIELLLTLLRNREQLSLDLNIKDTNGHGPIEWAITNNLYSISFLLEKAKVAALPHFKKLWLEKISASIRRCINQDYLDAEKIIAAKFNKLPPKGSLSTDEENAKFDNQRLFFIIHTLQFLIKYHLDLDDTSFIKQTLDVLDKEVHYYCSIGRVREYIFKISLAIDNLSGSFKKKYKGFLEPLTWITLEQFGAVVKPVSYGRFYLPISFEHLEDLSHRDYDSSLMAFVYEFRDLQEIIDEAIPSFLCELPVLETLFHTLLEKELKKEIIDKAIKPFQAPHIKAFTRYFLENIYLIQLLNLLGYSDGASPPPISKLSVVLTPKKTVNVSTKLDQHAILRRFQKIGELLTGKKSDFTDLDESIDFRALITVRDGICHQDEHNNKYIVDTLLKNPGKLEKMAKEELASLFLKVSDFIIKRTQIYGKYRENAKEHWGKVFQIEKKRVEHPLVVLPAAEDALTVRRRITEEQEREFLRLFDSVVKLIVITEPKKVIEQCQALFNGTSPTLNKMEMGQLQASFSELKKTGHKDLYKQITNILTEANTKPHSTLVERQRKREQAELEAKERKLARERALNGLENLRDLAKSFSEPPNRFHVLNPLKRIEAALEALNNMKEFLERFGYLRADKKYQTMEDWDAYHEKNGRYTFVQLLSSVNHLHDAIEYNLGQCLQHLDTIRTYTESLSSKYLTSGYEKLRALRNYIEHGNLLIEGQKWGDEASNLFLNQKIIAPRVIEFIFELLPELEQIKQTVEAAPVKKKPSALTAQSLFQPRAPLLIGGSLYSLKEKDVSPVL